VSRRKHKRRGGWEAWVDPNAPTAARTSPADVLAERISTGVAAAVNALHSAGASDVHHGWITENCSYTDGHWTAISRHGEQVPAMTPVPLDGWATVWWFEATMCDGTTVEGRSEPTTNHALAILDAAAQILRGAGRVVGRVG
jgi:hypothetical protein